MDEIKVFTRNRYGEKLAGIYGSAVSKNNQNPTVILVHGFGVEKNEGGMFSELATHLAEAGISSYRFDFTGRGDSEGDYSETTLTKLSEDLASILDFVRKQPRTDPLNIGIHAQSFGTITTVKLHPVVQAVVLTGTVARPYQNLKRIYGKDYNPDSISTIHKSNREVIKLRPEFWKDIENYSGLEDINRIKCPVLFIHGELDEKVPLEEMGLLFSAYKGTKKKLILPGANHSLQPGRTEMYQHSAQWFKKYLTIN